MILEHTICAPLPGAYPCRNPKIRVPSCHSVCRMLAPSVQPRCYCPVRMGTTSGMQWEVRKELTTSSAVHFPIRSARLRLRVVWTGLRSIRCTYSAARVPRISFTRNFVFFIMSFASFCIPASCAAGELAAPVRRVILTSEIVCGLNVKLSDAALAVAR